MCREVRNSMDSGHRPRVEPTAATCEENGITAVVFLRWCSCCLVLRQNVYSSRPAPETTPNEATTVKQEIFVSGASAGT